MFLRNFRTLYNKTARISLSNACTSSSNRLPPNACYTRTFPAPNFQQDPSFVVAGTSSLSKRFYSSSKDDINESPYSLLNLRDLGVNLETFECHKWHVEQGEAIKTGDVLLEVFHDKFFTTKVCAKEPGYIAKILVNDDSSNAAVDTPIAVIAQNKNDLVYSDNIDLFIENITKKKTVAANVGENYIGTHTFADGSTYNGEWKDNKHHGHGTYTFADGSTYIGGWKDGNEHGQGTSTLADGSSYIGDWKNGKPHGLRTITFADGSSYFGDWKHGNKHGQGISTLADGSSYIGDWKNDKPHGQGTSTLADGSSYVGGWKDGNKHRQGTLTSADGCNFYCEWNDGNLIYQRREEMNENGEIHDTDVAEKWLISFLLCFGVCYTINIRVLVLGYTYIFFAAFDFWVQLFTN